VNRTIEVVSSAESQAHKLQSTIESLRPWFHNIRIHGIQTAPDHFLGDFPAIKWQPISLALPDDLEGMSVLDVGCNAGFYSIELKRRGAGRVVAVDIDDHYLDQARFASAALGLNIEFRKMSVYEVDTLPGQFDYVLFMGVFYHLRYPIYALDKIVSKVGKKLVFQSMLRGSNEARPWKEDYSFWETEMFHDPDFPCMYFVEQSYAGDSTNWWIPNRGAAEAVLRCAGLEIVDHPEAETWICTPKR